MITSSKPSSKWMQPPGQGTHTNKLTVGCWNINGLFNENGDRKFNDPQVKRKIKDLDIMAFLETHNGPDTHVSIDNYWCYSVSRKKSNNNRYFGGILLCICYIPPDNSAYLAKKNLDLNNIIEGDLSTLSNDAEFLICGDLNARTGNIQDLITLDDNNHIPSPGNYICDTVTKQRSTQDTTINKRDHIIDLCIGSQLLILNKW